MENAVKIFIIDDDPVHHYLTHQICVVAGISFVIQPFFNGKEALDYLTAHHFAPAILPDVILLDINMPIMNGWQFLQELEPHTTNVSRCNLYIVSSSIATDDIEKSKTFTMVKEFISKPLATKKVKEIVALATTI
jgi:CheY-like chemotaxis protein